MATKKQTSGGARLIASGKRPVTLGVPPATHDMLTEAAQIDGRPLTQFILHHIAAVARQIISAKTKKKGTS